MSTGLCQLRLPVLNKKNKGNAKWNLWVHCLFARERNYRLARKLGAQFPSK